MHMHLNFIRSVCTSDDEAVYCGLCIPRVVFHCFCKLSGDSNLAKNWLNLSRRVVLVVDDSLL